MKTPKSLLPAIVLSIAVASTSCTDVLISPNQGYAPTPPRQYGAVNVTRDAYGYVASFPGTGKYARFDQAGNLTQNYGCTSYDISVASQAVRGYMAQYPSHGGSGGGYGHGGYGNPVVRTRGDNNIAVSMPSGAELLYGPKGGLIRRGGANDYEVQRANEAVRIHLQEQTNPRAYGGT